MANILLVQVPLSSNELFTRGSKQSASVIPPLGLAYIAAFLMKKGHNCTILDGFAESITIDEIVKKAASFDVVGITSVSSSVLRAMQLIVALKQNLVPCPSIIVGGPHSTVLPESVLKYGADFVVIGEGEITALKLIEYLARGTRNSQELYKIKGIGFSEAGKYVFTGHRKRIEPLDLIPMPAYDLLPMNLYHSSIARDIKQPSLSLFTSRGCPGLCSFCSKATFGTKVRYFSVERIVSEFFLLRDKYKARSIAIYDDNFISNPNIVQNVCEELIRKRFDIPFSIEARVDCVSLEVLKTLKKAGCSYIAYGVESGSQKMLDYMNKRITLDKIREVVALTKTVGIPMRCYFMMGFPGETLEEIEQTIKFAIELDAEVASFTLLLPLPGTLEYQRAQQSGDFDPYYYEKFILPEFNFPDKALYVPDGMTQNELLSIHRKAYSRYYYRPRVIMKRLASIRSVDDVKAMIFGGTTLIANFLGKK